MPDTAREASAAYGQRGSSPLSRPRGGAQHYGMRTGGDAPPAKRQKGGGGSGSRKVVKRSGGSSSAGIANKRGAPKPLPPGWTEEIRVPQSGRQYRVYIGPKPGLYAESRTKAWEAYERITGKASPHGTGLGSSGGGKGLKPAGRRVCLACDYGRKRKCTCGNRARRF